VQIADLMTGAYLRSGSALVFERPRVGTVHKGVVTDDGRIRLPDGSAYNSPSRAAVMAAGGGSFDGWHAWQVEETGIYLDTLRQQLLAEAISDTADPTVSDSDAKSRHDFLLNARQAAEKERNPTVLNCS
jgi:hypothetical protein